MKLNGAAILIECLIEQGVGTVFGFPGGAVLPIYDELYKRQDRIHHVLTAHEQHAGHAADGYARASGKTGVCIATSGPGATNLVTPIATAYMDSTPIVFITGNVPQSLMGTDSFQEADISGMTMPVTKHNYLVTRVDRLADIVREALPAVFFGDVAELVLIRRGVAVPEVVIPEHDIPALREMPHKGVIAADVLRHAVHDVQIPDGLSLREIDLPPECVGAVRGRDTEFFCGDLHHSFLFFRNGQGFFGKSGQNPR